RVAEAVNDDLRLRLVREDVEEIPDAHRQVYLVEAVPYFGVDERFRPVTLPAQAAEPRLCRGELAVVGPPRQCMEPAEGIVSGQRSAPVRAFLGDADPGHGIDQAGLTGAPEYRRQGIDPGDRVFGPVDRRRPIERATSHARDPQVGRKVHALGAGVQAVSEVLKRPDAE